MGYDFRAQRKDVGGFHLGAFSWPWMLEAGPGIIFGYRRGIEPASFIARPDARGRLVTYNDGFRCTARDARILARLLRELVNSERYRWEQWEKLPAERRAEIEAAPMLSSIYQTPVRKDFIDKAEEFAAWAAKSGGFTVH